ncbi:MAG: DUF134 domain-containing protein [Candidatus Baldrarchaeia archaeon]
MPQHRHRWGWRRRGEMPEARGPGRPPKPRVITALPTVAKFSPTLQENVPVQPKPPIFLSYDEYEALRLIDYEGLTQEEAGERMGVSRGTIWRLIKSARKKVSSALIEGRELVIVPQAPIILEEKCEKEEVREEVKEEIIRG